MSISPPPRSACPRPIGALRVFVRTGALLLASALLAAGFAQELTPVRFTLDWAFQGPQAVFLIAEERGYFAEEGIDITIDRGFGSAGTVSQIAGGAYDAGFADINSMIEFNAQNPGQALTAIAMVYNAPPFAIVTTADTGIAAPADLAGATLGAPSFDAAFRLFPLFADATGLDADAVSWNAMDPALREPALIRGEVDAISGFSFTSVLNLEAAGVARDEIVVFPFGDLGVSVYGNAVMAPRAWLDANPDAAAGLVRAVARGWRDALADPEAAVASVKAADPLVDEAVELERLRLAIEGSMLTDEVRSNGFGAVDPARLERSVEEIVAVFGLERTPPLDEVFDGSFLPPLDERLPPAGGAQ